MGDLPKRWVELELRECVDVLDNLRIPVNSEDRAKRQGKIPYYGATGQVGWIDKFIFDEELILIGEDGAPFFDKTKPIAYIIKGKSWVNNHAHVLRAMSNVTTSQYLKHYFDWFDFHGYVNGTTRLKLTQGSMKQIPVRLAPPNEQRHIVAKLEKLLDKVDACRARLEKIPVILKRFRQAALAAACSGRLTADWRGCLDAENWVSAKLSDLGIVNGGITKNSKRKDLPYQVKYISVANVYQNELRLNLVGTIGVSESEFNRTLLCKDDLLFVEGNGSIDQVGRVALWNDTIYPCLHQNHIIKFRANDNLNAKYGLFWMMAPPGRNSLMEAAVSTAGLYNLSISKIENVQIMVPPLQSNTKSSDAWRDFLPLPTG